MKTNELVGAALDWAVAEANGTPIYRCGKTLTRMDMDGNVYWLPSINWEQGGVIIERERISISPRDGYWEALYHDNLFQEDGSDYFQMGDTPLVAAMRCYVASKLGDEVQLPEELK